MHIDDPLPTMYPCRAHCGACCIAPSISSPIPNMPHGKPAGIRCVHLTHDLRCSIFHDPRRPDVCRSLKPSAEMCQQSAAQALSYLITLEQLTGPSP